MSLRPCIVPGCRVLVARGSRCPAHQLRTRAGWREDRRLVQQWVEQHGLRCPGLAGRAPHAVRNVGVLTVHHVVPLARGGPQDGPRMVVCRSCNSSAGAR